MTEYTHVIRFFGGERLTIEAQGPVTNLVVGQHKLEFSPSGFFMFMETMKKREKELKKYK